MEHEHTFVWPHSEPHSVTVTGTFDDWKSTVPLHRDANNQYSAKVKLPYDAHILYKYVVDGNWVTHHSQQTQSDSSGNVNNVLTTPSAPQQGSHEPGAPLKEVADSTEAPNTESITHALEAAAGAASAAIAGAAAVATAAVQSAMGTSPPTQQSAEGTPINAASSSPSVAVPPEKPAEPAPTPAHLKDVKSEASLPTVPSGEDLQKAVEKDPSPTSASNGPMLTGLAPVDERKSTAPSDLTAVEAAGPNASQAGPAKGQPFMRLAETTAAAGAVGVATAAGVGAASAKGKETAKPIPPVSGIEVYKPDGSVGKDADIAVPEPSKGPASSGAASGAAAASSATASKPSGQSPAANGINVHNPQTSKLEPAPTAVAGQQMPQKKSDKSAPKAAPAGGDVFAAPSDAAKGKDAKAGGEKYGPVGNKAGTVPRKSVPALDSSAPNTPAKEDYKTAPSTPANDTPGGLQPGGRGQMPRTTSTSFFGKLRASLSPSKKK